MSTQRLAVSATVTSSNGRPMGPQVAVLDSLDGDVFGIRVLGRDYLATGKTGRRFDDGREVAEFATEDDARLWATACGRIIWMD